MKKSLYYFSLIFILILIFGNIFLILLSQPHSFLEILSFLLVIFLSLFALNVEQNYKSFFILLIFYFILLLVNKFISLPYKDIISIFLEILPILFFFLLIKPYLDIKITLNFLISILFFICIVFLPFFFRSFYSISINRRDIFIFLINSFSLLLIILKIFIYFRGEYMFPWLYIFLGFLLKYFGNMLGLYDILHLWSIFLSLGILKYLKVYPV